MSTKHPCVKCGALCSAKEYPWRCRECRKAVNAMPVRHCRECQKPLSARARGDLCAEHYQAAKVTLRFGNTNGGRIT